LLRIAKFKKSVEAVRFFNNITSANMTKQTPKWHKARGATEISKMCHLIFLLPIFGLPVFWFFPFNTALILYLAICAISMFLYYKIFQAMRAKVRNGLAAMLGKTGVVLHDIDPEGKIKYATEIWNAVAEGEKLLEGEKVVISGFSYGLRIIVKEAPGESN
jgi:membrane-bound ClpP family serine protease